MDFDWQDLAFHREIANVIDALDGVQFWPRLIRVLERHVVVESWVALCFIDDRRPHVCAEQAMPEGQIDLMFQDYLSTLYVLDPFFLAATEHRASGFFTLADVAPDNFTMTEYYQRYFRKNIVGDEVQFNVAIDAHRTLCLSLGATRRYSDRELALLTLYSQWVIALIRQRVPYEGLGETDVDASYASRGEHAEASNALGANMMAGTIGQMEGPAESVRDMRTRFGTLTDRLGRGALTAREIEVAMLSLSGHSSRAIAEKLAISFETVRAHKKHIYTKLGIGSQSELFAMFYDATRAGASLAMPPT
ncbi:LuxR family transcriptional regulator [Pararobbsia alpina]|uniref:helix-turn-helix transcriptional regulator n=1 Tax=Pararobbsia alpina TaxID=621374 RepID=UPI0039A6320C